MLEDTDNYTRRISWNSIILVSLGTAHLIFTQVTNSFLVVALVIFVGLDLVFPRMPDEFEVLTGRLQRLVYLTRIALIFFINVMAVILPTSFIIYKRLAEGPASNATDGLIQTEVAIGFLIDGKNPYAESYIDTILDDWSGGEPPRTPILGPLVHFVYLPFLVLGSVPFYLLGNAILGWYDQRLLYTALFLGTLPLLSLLVRRQRWKLTLISLVGLNFLSIFFLTDGRNDVAILFGLVLTTALLAKGHLKWSALVLGLTLMTKHQAWFFLPFYLLFSFPQSNERAAIKSWLFSIWPLYGSIILILVPFLVMDAHAFAEDTIGYIIGLSEYSFPIRGIGFSHILVATGVISSYQSSFPFWIFSLLFSIPALVYSLRRQWHRNTLANVWLGFVLVGFVFQFFSRFFNDNYLIFLVSGFFIAAFIDPVVFGNEEDRT
jgi:hypothetical protein